MNRPATVANPSIQLLQGENGAGKSTILKTILGLLRPMGGEIRVLGERLTGVGAGARAGVPVRAVILGLFLLLGAGIAAAAVAEMPQVTASTAWTGALAEAAGAEVDVLAGYELRHPPEYDFSPRDIQRAVGADFIVWGGYEGFIRDLVDAADIPDEKVVQVRTNNSPSLMREAVRVLAERFGTMDAYETFAEELDEKARELLEAAESAEVGSVRVAVNSFYEPLIEWLGYDIVVVFGPGEPTTGTIREVEEQDPDLIIDNWHVPLGKPFDTAEREYVQLINFPGHAGTRDLVDVLGYYERTLALSGGGGGGG